MSKHLSTHLFFHMGGDSSSSKHKESTSTTTSSTTSKPKKPSTLISGYEIDTNPPLPSESGDYYDYYTNYGIPDYYGPTSPSVSPSYAYKNSEYSYYDYRNPEYDYYNSGGGEGANYRDGPYENNAYGANRMNSGENYNINDIADCAPGTSASSSSAYYQHSTHHHQHPHHHSNPYHAPMVSPPVQDPRRGPPPSPLPGDHWSGSYRNDPRGLSAFAHKLHRITFVEACIFQPPDLPSPGTVRGPGPSGAPPIRPPPPPPPPVLAQGERSPTSTGGTHYYQEWTSKHMRHLCSRFEKPDQQQLLMNVERKSKYPFIILCTPESNALSKSSSCSSSKGMAIQRHHSYRREISHNSVYSQDDDDDEDEEEEHWITQKQRDSVNSHYLPPPPPPLLMPHIWPEIRYIDGLYTVCASIVRPGSGIPCEYDEYLYSDINSTFDQQMAGLGPGNNHHSQQLPPEKRITFQDEQQTSSTTNHHGAGGDKQLRPAGYIVSAFATFPGEDSDRLEKNWLFWTGARILYKYLPTCVGLRRLIFLKRCPDMYREDVVPTKVKPTIFTGFTYVLLCECFNLKESYIASVCTTIDQLRARCCGYSALYLTHFQQQQTQHHQQHRHPLQHMMSAPAGTYTASGGGQMEHLQHHHHHHQPPPQLQHQQLPVHHGSMHHIPQRYHRSNNDFSQLDSEWTGSDE